MSFSSIFRCLLCNIPKNESRGEKVPVSTEQYEIEGKNPGDSTDFQESIDSTSQFTSPDESNITTEENIAELPIQKSNRALIVAAKGAYSFADLPFPILSHEHEVVISNRATGLNPIDYKSVDYNFCLPEFPWITGREMAGVVEMVGAGVRDVKVGDHVWTSTYYRDRRAGCFQQYITVPAHTVLPLPPSTNFTSAASLGVAGLTAAMTLWHWLDVPFPPPSANPPPPANPEKQEQEQEQEFLLVWGGGTVTGQYALQLAAISHLRVIAITSSHTAPLARSLGAIVIERDNKSNTQIISEIKEIAGDNITRAIDLVGPKTASACLQVLSRERECRFAPLAMMGNEEVVARNVQVVTVEMKRFVLDEANRMYALELNRLVGEGRVQVPGIETVHGGLENVVLGLDRLKKGEMGGRKMVVVF
ncbi:Trans-enoyl reductase [Lachnellula occidentalis]|uniref:Trans-enoyl reductase n=1 Tax=Lachnellula occidentalis TaxID=215460 RepID=A0A8H8RHI5_9HELO|nr:Trans-enoyl reductase [Lachnellula occidentalis]